MKKTLQFLGFLLLGLIKVFPQEAPNVLFIAVDDLKPSIRAFGDRIAITPNLDFLARESSIFLNNHTQMAICSPSRVSLLTGLRPDYTQVWDLKTKMRDKNPDVITLPQYFKSNGYETVATGKVFDPRGVDNSYDNVSWTIPYLQKRDLNFNPDFEKPALGNYQDPQIRNKVRELYSQANKSGVSNKFKYVTKFYKPPVSKYNAPDDAYTDGAIANHAMELIDKFAKDDSKPFFLSVGFLKPHLPFSAPEQYWNLYNRNNMPLASYTQKVKNGTDLAYHSSGEMRSYIESGRTYPLEDNLLKIDSAFQKELIHGYYACVSFIDFQIGKLINKLKENGLYDNTIIVLWGDHGWHLGDHSLWNKHSNFEQATRSPLLIRVPNQDKQVRVTSPTEFVDIFPTLCELSGVKTLPSLQGKSLVPLITRSKNSIKKAAVSQYARNKSMGYSFRTSQYRYTVWLKKTLLSTDHINESDIIAEELYDYKNDPLETVNLVTDENYLEVYTSSKQIAKEFFDSKGIGFGNEYKEQSVKSFLQSNYNPNKVFIGATLNHSQLGTKVSELFLKDFTYSTPENCAKQARIHPNLSLWDWSLLEDYLAFATKNDITLRIHGPISPQASQWAKDDSRTKEELIKNMTSFFTALCKKINNHPNVKWMDVVNETVEIDGNWFAEKPGNNLWENPWTQIGLNDDGIPIYIVEAFKMAMKHAPNIKFVFNQHGGMQPKMWERVKSTILYLKAMGLRVDGVGWQAHLRNKEALALNKKELEYFSDLVDWTHNHGMEFHVTEIDYRIDSKALTSELLEEQANAYANILKVLLRKRSNGVITYNTWGLSDGLGKHHDKSRFMYTKDLYEKPIRNAIINALKDPNSPLVIKP